MTRPWGMAQGHGWRLSLLVGLTAVSSAVASEPAFVDASDEWRLDFRHQNGMVGKLYFAEHMGGGVALFDYDGDGDLDLYLGQGRMLGEDDPSDAVLPTKYPQPLSDRLYRNDLDSSGQRRFVDVTQSSKLSELALGYSMGVATGDIDNDGWVDLYITNLGNNHLLRNRGDGTFEDVTEAWGADEALWSVPASFLDYDLDGRLDLFVGNYVEFRTALHKNCASPQGAFDYCGPLAYPAEANRLLRNTGNGFDDVTSSSLIKAGSNGSTLGTVSDDFDGDGRVDLYIANDLMPNNLWLNEGDGTFFDDALMAGAAVDGNGQPQASMGLVAEDLNGDGSVDLFMTHLLRETNTLYLNDGQGSFDDATGRSGLGRSSYQFTGFGTAVLDFDGDGVRDLFVVNGGVRRDLTQLEAGDPHPLKQRNQLFRGLGSGRFEEVPEGAIEAESPSWVSRGLAAGDIDNDGDVDLVIANNGGPARLLVNPRRPERWVGIRVLQPGTDRDAYGAQVTVSGALGGPQVVRTDGSYASARDARVVFELGPAAPAQGVEVEVRWPGGEVESFSNVSVGGYVTLSTSDSGEGGNGGAP